MSSIDPHMLAALLAGGGGGPPPDGGGGPPLGGGPPAQADPEDDLIPQIIQLVHQAIAHEAEPEDKAVLGQCLQALLRLQAKNMREQNTGGARKAALGALGAQ